MRYTLEEEEDWSIFHFYKQNTFLNYVTVRSSASLEVFNRFLYTYAG